MVNASLPTSRDSRQGVGSLRPRQGTSALTLPAITYYEIPFTSATRRAWLARRPSRRPRLPFFPLPGL